MAELSRSDQRRITFLSLLSSAATIGHAADADTYELALAWLERMEDEGFFAAANPTPQRSERSERPASSSRSSNNSPRGRDGGRPFSGNYRDPNAPASEKQVNLALRLGADYDRQELEEMTMPEIGKLIDDLNNN